MARLTAELVDANQNSQSVSHLMRSNFSLFARKLVETNADTGEHYISRGRAEYLKMLRMAAGGGLVTVATVCVKFAITGSHLQSMLEGLLAGVNYAASFMLMHFLHFTLATKQPAMTAPTLARELDDTGHDEGVKAFVASVIALIRTQAAAISGNVLVVFPVCLLVQLLAGNLLHANVISPAKAHATLHSFSLLGPTPFYAALTGVLLWASSLLAGWADNWFVLHRVGDALTYNRRLRLTLGAAGAAKLAHFCRSNVAGVVANVGLGLMLGLVPAIVTVFLFPFEVRHVTLSAGAIGVAIGVLGQDAAHARTLVGLRRRAEHGDPQRAGELRARVHDGRALAQPAPHQGARAGRRDRAHGAGEAVGAVLAGRRTGRSRGPAGLALTVRRAGGARAAGPPGPPRRPVGRRARTGRARPHAETDAKTDAAPAEAARAAYNSGLLHVLTRLMSSPTLYEFFAPCPRGLEAALAAELAEIAGRHLNGAPFTAGAQVPGGVHFRGGWAAGMAANLHSRIASRILLKIAHRAYRNEQDVYALALEQPWERWFASTQTLRVDITAIKSPLKSLEFATLRVKDAICDRMREKTGSRPSIDTGAPDVRVFAFLTAGECTLYLDTSGEPLFKRGWRLDKGAAPLRENLAAGILRLTGWTPGTPLYDPMCGSGTFLAEAAQIALGVAPGVERRFGFEKLKQYDITAWQGLKVPALDAKRAARSKRDPLGVYGSDISGDMLDKARANLERAGVPSVWLKQIDARAMTPPCDGPASSSRTRRTASGSRCAAAARAARCARRAATAATTTRSAARTPTRPTASSSTRSAMR
jgi:putative N6-adenine-specific DNA methylase